jgi:hypothetical protein
VRGQIGAVDALLAAVIVSDIAMAIIGAISGKSCPVVACRHDNLHSS